MAEPNQRELLSGVVEIVETYIGCNPPRAIAAGINDRN
jgi:hypothetical protein